MVFNLTVHAELLYPAKTTTIDIEAKVSKKQYGFPLGKKSIQAEGCYSSSDCGNKGLSTVLLPCQNSLIHNTQVFKPLPTSSSLRSNTQEVPFLSSGEVQIIPPLLLSCALPAALGAQGSGSHCFCSTLQATEAAERGLSGGGGDSPSRKAGSEGPPASESAAHPVAETDKLRFLRWLRLLLFQLMLDIIEVKSLLKDSVEIFVEVAWLTQRDERFPFAKTE